MREEYRIFDRGTARGACIPGILPHLAFFLDGFGDWLARQPLTVYAHTPHQVAVVALPEPIAAAAAAGSVVVKRFGWRSRLHRLAAPVTRSRALRSLRVAQRLQAGGVNTPRPLIAWARYDRLRPAEDYYITQALIEATTARARLKSPERGDPGRMLADLARLVRALHDAGVWHRDLTLGNFLVTADGISLIDLSRAVILGWMPLPLRWVDLARIKLGEHWPAFYTAYCAGRPGWRAAWPILRALVWLRRRKMDLKRFWKTR